MKTYHVQISFLNRGNITIIDDFSDNATAITESLNRLNDVEKKNAIGVKITYIGDLH